MLRNKANAERRQLTANLGLRCEREVFFACCCLERLFTDGLTSTRHAYLTERIAVKTGRPQKIKNGLQR